MRYIYILTLFMGLTMAVVMQTATIAIPRDAFVASLLSREPDRWTITVDDFLKNALPSRDLKQDVVVALSKRARFTSRIYTQTFWEGTVLIILSVLGLIRERSIRNMKKKIEHATAN